MRRLILLLLVAAAAAQVVWKIEPDAATGQVVGSITAGPNNTAVYKAPDIVSADIDVRVKATSVISPSKSSTVTIKVKRKPRVASVTATATPSEIDEGGTSNLDAIVTMEETGPPPDGGSAGLVGASNTQAVFKYPATLTPCLWRASEYPMLSPLLHDVNPVLFPGANSDQRAGSVESQGQRYFVLGTRRNEQAADGKIYSRAIPANTTIYFDNGCGLTGSFRAKNIPFGLTYSDLPPVLVPTSMEAVDSQTGARVRPMSSTPPPTNATPYVGSGGYSRICSPQIVGPDNGYLCAFPTLGGGPAVAYYYVPSTGQFRYLGMYVVPAAISPEGFTRILGYAKPGPRLYFAAPDAVTKDLGILRGTYIGDFSAAAAPDTWLPIRWERVDFPDGSLLKAFQVVNPDVQIRPEAGCSLPNEDDDYLLIDCRIGQQDAYSDAIGIINGLTGRAVAARNMMTEAPTRYCGTHNFHFLAPFTNTPILDLQLHGLWPGALRPSTYPPGAGPYTVTLASPFGLTDTQLHVTAQPATSFAGDLAMSIQPGDRFQFFRESDLRSSDIVEVRSVSPAPTGFLLDVVRMPIDYIAPTAHAAGERLFAQCGTLRNNGDGWNSPSWKFLDDPTGSALIINPGWPTGGHDDATANMRLTEGYPFVRGPISETVSKPANELLLGTPSFSGVRSLTYGSATSMHPTLFERGTDLWFTDGRPFNGGNMFSEQHTRVSGSLWKYRFPVWRPDSILHRKTFPTLAFTQNIQLRDISGPGSRISDGPDGDRTYCVVDQDGECLAASKRGDVYANVVDLAMPWCQGSDSPNPTFRDLCILDNPPHGQAIFQAGFAPNKAGVMPDDPPYALGSGWSRVLSRGFGPVRSITTLAKPTPDGRVLLFASSIFAPGSAAAGPLLAMDLPPFSKDDTIDRSTFVPVPVQIPASSQVFFGYAEFGAPDQYFCTTRRDRCTASGLTFDPANPFRFESEGAPAIPCPAGTCTVSLPGISGRVLYWQAGTVKGAEVVP